ncbi:hypothetical protein ONZ51_g6324 [Trametes cubensis]|uniref:DUF8212 domain-containing protein n=1 Tax=Trametes cubensis TaxID=1111947 RepID=A0AAD7XB82_9APHY|nr:hypothetical protein ONZ51_g6324 [Trametes cubensis]
MVEPVLTLSFAISFVKATSRPLSHTWYTTSEGGEQTYEDIRTIQATIAPLRTSNVTLPGAPPPLPSILHSPELSEKIKGFCVYAREAGYDLAWADMCYIDKSSSAELSEAINSMYEWYRLANVCYVYLADVFDDEDPERARKAFCRSKWHTRGWTLQELLAPRRVVFLSRTWTVLGTKLGMAATLEQISGISTSILTGRTDLRNASVAQRMAWAADRQTTRLEDRAYSLMGIFGVFMSPVYGEGHNAFIRLQKEIIKTISDQTIFAWGSFAAISAESHSIDVVTAGPCSDIVDVDLEGDGLLAMSPSAFKYSSHIVPVPSTQFARALGKDRDSLPPLHCTFTPQGISIQLPCIDTDQRRILARVKDLLGRPAFYGRLGLLRCRVRNGPFIALPLPYERDRGKEDYLKIQSDISITSTPGQRSMTIFGRTIRLSESFFGFARSRGWKLNMKATLLLASGRAGQVANADWNLHARTTPNPTAHPPRLELAPWCEHELGSVAFVVTSHSTPRNLPTPNAFVPMYITIAAAADPHPHMTLDGERPHYELRITVGMTVYAWDVPDLNIGLPDAKSQFFLSVTHIQQHGDSRTSQGVVSHKLLLRVSELAQDGAGLYVEQDARTQGSQVSRDSPFYDHVLRATVQSAPQTQPLEEECEGYSDRLRCRGKRQLLGTPVTGVEMDTFEARWTKRPEQGQRQ